MNSEIKALQALLKYRRVLRSELVNLTGLSPEIISTIITNNTDSLKLDSEEIIVANPIQLALKLANYGVELRKISRLLNWKDFEMFTSQILYGFGYEVLKSVKMTTPIKFEVDLIGVEEVTGFTLLVDCKHWSTMPRSRLIHAAIDHAERVKKVIRYYQYLRSKYRVLGKIKEILPLILTLLKPRIRLYENILFISIEEFPELLRNKHKVLDYYELKLIRLK
ncbi:MAG: hypothetical protein QXE81_06450 [Desulfurococcaceae archaeon]